MSDASEIRKLRPRASANNFQFTALESSKPLSPSSHIVYLERNILPSDSLQSFALQYGCTLNDIKRANNLMTELDFHARKCIKIPVKRYGLLTDPKEELKRRPVTAASMTAITSASATVPHYDQTSDSLISSGSICLKKNSCDFLCDELNLPSSILRNPDIIDGNDSGRFLKKMDKDIRNTVRNHDNLQKDMSNALKEVVSSHGSVEYRPLPIPASNLPVDYCDGADWGLKWWVLLLCFVAVIITCIFVGVEYYLSHEQLYTLLSSQHPSSNPK